jgi:hypothetical protein
MKLLCFMLIALLTGCANYPRLGLPLVQEDADRIKTIQVIVMAQQEPLRISRTRYDSSQTVALRTVGGYGGAIAASAMESSANNRYIRSEQETGQITKPLLEQVDGMDYREVLRNQLESALNRNGRFKITQVIGVEDKYGDFGSAKYIQNSDSNAVLFVSATLEMSPGLGLSNQVHYRLVAKSGEVILNDYMSFSVLPPEPDIQRKIAWWNNANRYRNAVVHSGYAVATLLNDQIFGKNDFISRAEFLKKFNDPGNPVKWNTTIEPDRQKQVCDDMPNSDEYVVENYAIRKVMVGAMYDVILKCQARSGN